MAKLSTCLVLLGCIISIVFAQTPASSTALDTDSTTSIESNSTLSSTQPSTTSQSIFITPFVSIAPSTHANAEPTVQPAGFNQNGNNTSNGQQSWLKEHNRFVFIIFVGLIILCLLIWYIVRSVKGMRKRLEAENQVQLYMMQQASAPPPLPQQNHYIPELTQSPPPAYKTEQNTPVQPANSGQTHY